MDCREAQSFIELSIDGEMEPEERARFEAHLASCPVCSQKYHSKISVHEHVRTKLQESHDHLVTPAGLKHRIAGELAIEERARRLPVGRALLPASIVAAGVAVFAWSAESQPLLNPQEAVARHSRNLPPEVRGEAPLEDVDDFLRKNLRYRVRVPRFVGPPSGRAPVRLVGARLASMQNRDAAYVMYDRRGARISLFAFPRPRRPVKPHDFVEREVAGRSVLVGQYRGYNMVSWQQDDLVYSLVSDVDPEELIRLVSHVR